MRALLVGASPDHVIPRGVASLVDSVDLVIAVDGGLDLCAESGVHAHLVVGDMDSLKQRSLLESHADRSVLYPSDKDVTDLDLALAQARESGVTEIVATGFIGGRLDHTLSSIGSFARFADLKPVLHSADSSMWLLASEGRESVTLVQGGSAFSLVAVTSNACVSCTGARYPLDSATLPLLGSLGISNVVTGASETVTVTAGAILVLTTAYTLESEADWTSDDC
jgi:thiamine pyrophosphokinase